MMTTAIGAPNEVCARLRDALRGDATLTARQRGHLDACVERAVHAYAGSAEKMTVTLMVTPDTFRLTFA